LRDVLQDSPQISEFHFRCILVQKRNMC
jgi:hypothetical protein